MIMDRWCIGRIGSRNITARTIIRQRKLKRK